MKNEKDFLQIDIEEITSIEVAKEEKQAVIRHILQKPIKVFKLPKWVVAALIAIGISSVGIMSISTVASKLPIVEQFLSYFSKDEQLSRFADNSSIVATTSVSNGITMKVEDALYDGNLVSLSFSLESEQPLDNLLFMENLPKIAGHEDGSDGGFKLKKINEDTYIGFLTITLNNTTPSPSSIELTWEPGSFLDINRNTLASGDWNFSIELNKIQGNELTVNQTISSKSHELVIDYLSFTKYATVIYFSGDLDFATEIVTLDITDNLGNHYEEAPTTSMKVTDKYSTGTVVINDFNSSATSIFITPTIHTTDVKWEKIEKKQLETVEIHLNEYNSQK